MWQWQDPHSPKLHTYNHKKHNKTQPQLHENSNKPSLRARIRQDGRGNQTAVNQILKKIAVTSNKKVWATKNNSYFALYWLFNWDLYNGLRNNFPITGQYNPLYYTLNNLGCYSPALKTKYETGRGTFSKVDMQHCMDMLLPRNLFWTEWCNQCLLKQNKPPWEPNLHF